MGNNINGEYYILTDKLDEINWALDGQCNDIDCDKYIYKDLLKKKYKPVLEHNFSCVKKLKHEKLAILRILSQNKYKKYRYIKCPICKDSVDKLSEKNTIKSFTKLLENKMYEWNGIWVHKKCSKKLKTPDGWKTYL